MSLREIVLSLDTYGLMKEIETEIETAIGWIE
jgi:hypothetical protein